ncbi:PucR family transcriptional regulator [Rhodococcus ruber]|uniref:PucR family transcriptional regulator n=1 Tax=Rhodococcus ruber TaxID=1830 RepID=UPI00265FEDCA|nr:helix-turn-helix domain-containing protein [Rhodococcus ruber]MDO1481610.1 helix-turn-helix domain-containing protein [Rhodococcus ruber]
MTTRPPQAAVSILERVQRSIDVIADNSPDVAVLQPLPRAIRENEIPSLSRRLFTRTVEVCLVDGTPSERDLEISRNRAIELAADGVPLPLVLHNWQYGTKVFWQACAEAAGTTFAEGLAYIGEKLLDIERTHLCAVAEAYQTEQAVLRSEERGANQLLTQLLLTGHGTRHDLERFGIELADSYVVLAVAFAQEPDEATEDPVGRGIAGMRKLRRVQRSLQGRGQPPLLVSLEPDGGVILLPVQPGAGNPHDSARSLIARLGRSARVSVTAALGEPCDLDLLQIGGTQTQELLTVVVAAGLPPGTYRMEDVALAYQLTRPSPSSAHLANMLQPLDSHPELLGTLEAYVHHDLDRGRTARALGVHPNTINNRLNRISELLRRDLGRISTIIEVAASLTVRARGTGAGSTPAHQHGAPRTGEPDRGGHTHAHTT